MAKLFLLKKIGDSAPPPPAPVAPTYVALSTQVASDGLEVGDLIATITSDGDAPVAFSEQADPDSKFTVSGNQLLLGAAIDYQAATSHSVTIRATNAGGYVEQEFTITVSDADGTFLTSPSLLLDAGAVAWKAGEYVACDFELEAGVASCQWFYFTNPADIDGTKTNISAGAVAPSPLLPVEAPFAFRAAYFLDTATFGGANADTRYIGCDVTTGSTTERAVYTDAAIGDIAGTAISQSSFSAAGLLTLSSADTTYYLTEDIETDGSAIAVTASGITLNLNGKTITWNNATPISFANGDFESGATGWDWTGTGNAGAGVDTLGTDTYVDLPTAADHETGYNSKLCHDGVRSARFKAAACGDNAVVRYFESAEFTCATDKWYSVSFIHFYTNYGGTIPTLRVKVMNSGSAVATKTISQSSQTNYGVFNKGPAYHEVMFKAVASPATYTIRVEMEGTTGATGAWWIDAIQVNRGRTDCIAVGPTHTTYNYSGTSVTIGDQWQVFPNAQAPEWSSSANCGNLRVKNGSLVQGQDAGAWAAGLTSYWHASGANRLNRVTVEVSGRCASTISGYDGASVGNMVVQDCALTTSNTVCAWREAWYGANAWNVQGTIERTTLLGGAAAGVYTQASMAFAANTIRTQSRYTNQFAFIGNKNLGGSISTCTLHNNTFNNTDGYYGRCISFGGAIQGTIRDNVVAMTPSRLEAEYGGFYSSGEWAIQLEEQPNGATISAYNNTITCTGSGAATYNGNIPKVHALRINETANGGTINFYDNSVTVTASDTWQGYLVAPETIYSTTGLNLYNNTWTTNGGIAHARTLTGDFVLRGSSINYATPAAATQYPFGIPSEGVAASATIEFRDISWLGGSYADVSVKRPVNLSTGGYSPDFVVNTATYKLTWTVTFTGADTTAIQVRDKTDSVVASGEISGGSYAVVLPESTHTSAGINYHNLGGGYEYSVNGGAWTALAVDQTKSVSV